MSRHALQEWIDQLSEEEINAIVKQVLRDLQVEEGRTELRAVLLAKKPWGRNGRRPEEVVPG